MDENLIKAYADKYGKNDAETIARAMAFKNNVASRDEPDNNSKIAALIEAGTKEIAGRYESRVSALEYKETSEEDRKTIASIIEQGTCDILAHPNLSPEAAIRFGDIGRKVDGQR